MKKKYYTTGLLKMLLLLVLTFSTVGAQTIGGEVFSKGNVLPSWQNVFVYDVDNVNKYIEASVSPDGYRYSFENSNQDGRIFSDDEIIRSEILDFKNGFMAGPVNMNLGYENNKYYSCEDCDIFSKMELRKVVQVKQPDRSLIVSEDGKIDVEINVYDGCDFYYDNQKLCESGCDYRNNFSENFGLNNLRFVTDCHTGKREKGGSREIFSSDDTKNISFSKELIIVPNGEILISFSGTKTEGIFPVTDFVPDEFEVFNVTDGGLVFDEDGYYSIEWKNVSGNDFNFSYYIKPRSKVRSCDIGITNGDILRKSFEDKINLMEGYKINLSRNNFYFDCNFSNDIAVYVVENVDFKRVMNDKLKKGKNVKVKLSGEISSSVNAKFKEYIPISFNVSSISDAGVLESSSSGYNVIVWNVSGSDFNFNYKAVPTVSGEFYFISELGGEKIDEKTIKVSGYSSHHRGGNPRYKYEPVNFSVVTQEHPLIETADNITVALYSNKFVNNGAFEIFGIDFAANLDNRSLKFLKGYSFENNLGENTGGMSFEYKSSKKELRDKGYSGLEFYGVDSSGKRNKITGMSVHDEGESIVYKFDGDKFFRNIVVYGVKEKLNFFDKFVEFWWWVKSFFIKG